MARPKKDTTAKPTKKDVELVPESTPNIELQPDNNVDESDLFPNVLDKIQPDQIELDATVVNKKPLVGKTVSPRGDTTGKVKVWDPGKRVMITGFIPKEQALKLKRDFPHIEIINEDEQA